MTSSDIEPDGGSGTSDELLPEVYDELRKLARARLAREREPDQTLQPTALVHEAYLRVSGGQRERRWDRRGHFFAAAGARDAPHPRRARTTLSTHQARQRRRTRRP